MKGFRRAEKGAGEGRIHNPGKPGTGAVAKHETEIGGISYHGLICGLCRLAKECDGCTSESNS